MTFPVFPGSNPSGYNLTRSVRLRASASATLTRTFGSTYTDKTKWTMSFWVKRGKLNDGAGQIVMNYASGGSGGSVGFSGAGSGGASVNDDFVIGNRNATTGVGDYTVRLLRLFRDPSAWYHIVVKFDSTQATASNRVLIYVNGEQQSGFGSDTAYPALNFQSTAFLGGNAVAHQIGYGAPTGAPSYFDGYLAEFYWIDGQALTASSFGTTNTLTGVWQPAPYTGTYGANGFYTPYSDNSALTTSSNVGLGKDFSGNGNYWTTNNISITAGVTYDSMTDVPTLTSATAGNYCVINPIGSYFGGQSTLTDGNLNYQSPNPSSNYAVSGIRGTIGFNYGAFYWEALITTTPGANGGYPIGVVDSAATINTGSGFDNGFMWSYNPLTGQILVNGSSVATVATATLNDVIGFAFDRTNGQMKIYKNNSLLTTQTATPGGSGGSWIPAAAIDQGFNNGRAIGYNFTFGQRPFAYTPPTGYVALNTYNLPTSTIVKGNTVMDATLWTGNGSTQNIVNAAPFRPDLVWIKIRSAVGSHRLLDSVRGATNTLASNLTNAEFVDSTGLTAFNSNGFTLGADGSYNGSGSTYVGWQWQAGQGTTSTNTSGTITSTVSVNASAGFSVVTFTGTGANATVGHGLGVAPQLIILKPRNSADNWPVWHGSFAVNEYVYLNLTNAKASYSLFMNGTLPSSSVISLGTWANVNSSGQTMVAYCWTPIAGYSAFGSYTGNGSSDGTFVYTGFRPRWVMAKRTDTTGDWILYDTSRSPYNLTNLALFPNGSYAEATATVSIMDIVSNGFKCRGSGTELNASGGTYIYACFAENPFKNALAR